MKNLATLVLMATALLFSSSVSAQSKKKFEKQSIEQEITELKKKKKEEGLSKHEKEKLKYLKRKQKIEAKRKKRRAKSEEFNKYE